jgi:dihydrodipicolinate synthase/N-acetylneuraminate lyase
LNAIPNIRGIVCPMVTPFDESDQIDHAATRQVVEFLLARGIDCLMVAGTTGEGMLLRVEERKTLLATVVEAVAGQAPVIAHTGCINTADTIELTRHAAAAGATAASVIAPYFYTLDDESLFNHYLAVAKAVPGFPIFVYVFPGNAKNDISPSLLERLIEAAPNIVGCKSSNPDLIRFQGYVRAGGERFLSFNGVDGLMLPALVLGSKAQVSGNSNVCPEIFCELYAAFQAGNVARARATQARINRIRAVLHDGITPAFFKLGLKLRGVPAGRVRPPMQELTPEQKKQVEQELRALEVIRD